MRHYRCRSVIRNLTPKIRSGAPASPPVGLWRRTQAWAQAEAHYRQAWQSISVRDCCSQASTCGRWASCAGAAAVGAGGSALPAGPGNLHRARRSLYIRPKPTSHLGMVAQEQRQWAQAEAHYCAGPGDFRSSAATAIPRRNLPPFGDGGAGAAAVGAGGSALPEGPGDLHRVRRSLFAGFHLPPVGDGGAASSGSGRQAQAHYRQALAIKIECIGDRYSQALHLPRVRDCGAGAAASGRRRKRTTARPWRSHIEYGDRYSQAATYHHFGDGGAASSGRWAQAEAHYQKALEIRNRVRRALSRRPPPTSGLGTVSARAAAVGAGEGAPAGGPGRRC